MNPSTLLTPPFPGAPIKTTCATRRPCMSTEDVTLIPNQVIFCTVKEAEAEEIERILTAAGVECRLLPATRRYGEFVVLIDETEALLAEVVAGKRKKDVEEGDETDDEEEEEDDLDEGDDEDDFDDEEDEDDFEEEFGDDELDD